MWCDYLGEDGKNEINMYANMCVCGCGCEREYHRSSQSKIYFSVRKDFVKSSRPLALNREAHINDKIYENIY